MGISIFVLLLLALLVVGVVVLGNGPKLSRRLRRPRLVQWVVLSTVAVLVPVNVWCVTAHDSTSFAGGMLAFSDVVLSLLALGGIAVLVMRLRIERELADNPRRVLAIGAHPDDLELGCGGTMAKLADSGHEVNALVMTSGEQGGDRGTRPGEAQLGGKFVGVADLELLELTDTRLQDHELDMGLAIEGAIDRFDPDIILTHSANDQHQDHLAVHRATLRAARQHPAILCYESPSATHAFEPRVFIDIGDYMDVKTAAVGTHRDQRSKPYMSAERVRGLAVYRGGQAKVRHAEGYEPVRLLSSVAGEL